MKQDIMIISYNDYRDAQSPPRTVQSPQRPRTASKKNGEKLDPKTRIELPLTQRVPILFNNWRREALLTLTKRGSFIRQNFLKDFFFGCAFTYPFTGLLTILTHRIYWNQLLIFAFCYVVIFMIIGITYYVILVPTILAWAVVTLGPLGAIIVHIQWLLQTNALTSMVCTNIILTQINNRIFDTTLYLHGQGEFLREAKYIKIPPKNDPKVNWKMAEYWAVSLPMWGTTLMRQLIILIVISSISVIPIVGPTVANQLVSARRAFSYMKRYFTLKSISNSQAKNFQYKRLGLFFSFGMTAGWLELIPLFSIITITSNTVGAAQWSVELINKNPNLH